MMKPALSLLLGLFALTACQHTQADVPAVLADDSEATRFALKQSLMEALSDNSIRFGASDPAISDTFSILPMPLSPEDDRSLASPTLYKLVLRGATCLAVRQEDGTEFELPDVPCRAL